MSARGRVARTVSDLPVVNHTPYPTPEVAYIVRRAMSDAGALPVRVVVNYRRSPTDTREGFTPFDRTKPTLIWVEPAGRYPEPGARSWREELFLDAAHEAGHTRHPGPCPNGICETVAENYAHAWYRRVGLGNPPTA